VFVRGKPIQPSLLFVSKAEVYLREAPFRSSTVGYVPGLTHKHYVRLERPAREKHWSFKEHSINYGHKKFYNNGPEVNPKIFKSKFALSCCKLDHFRATELSF
jgi:hypothetical protein